MIRHIISAAILLSLGAPALCDGAADVVITISIFKVDVATRTNACRRWMGLRAIVPSSDLQPRTATHIITVHRLLRQEAAPTLRLQERLGFSEKESSQFPAMEVVVNQIKGPPTNRTLDALVRVGTGRVISATERPVVETLASIKATLHMSDGQPVLLGDPAMRQQDGRTPIGAFCLILDKRHIHRFIFVTFQMSSLDHWRQKHSVDPMRFDPDDPLPFKW